MLTVNLEETKRRVREALSQETPESLREWYNERRRLWQDIEAHDTEAQGYQILETVSEEFTPSKVPEIRHDWLNTIAANNVVVSNNAPYSYLLAA